MMPPPAIAAPRRGKNTKLGEWQKKSFWCKFRDLGSALSRSDDVINAKFSSFLLNMQDFVIAALAPKVRQIASIRKNQRKQMKWSYGRNGPDILQTTVSVKFAGKQKKGSIS